MIPHKVLAIRSPVQLNNGLILLFFNLCLDDAQEPVKRISFDPRVVGPLAIIGPATGVFGQTLKMTHIASSNNIRSAPPCSSPSPTPYNASPTSYSYTAKDLKSGNPEQKKGKDTSNAKAGAGAASALNSKPFHFVTWNDEGTGEYGLWTIIANRREKETIQFEWFPRLLYPHIRDRAWLEVSTFSEQHI